MTDRHPTRTIAKRSLSLSRTYMVLSIAIAANGILFPQIGSLLLNEKITASGGADLRVSAPLLSVPLLSISVQTISIPVILLYVYDRNTGVLERFLSLGMNPSDVYRRYLKAAVLLASCFLPFVVTAHVIVGTVLRTGEGILLETSLLIVVLSLSVVTLLVVLMMAFSSFQKQRVGANQPVGLAIGGLAVVPDYVIPFLFPHTLAVLIEIAIAGLIAAVALILLLLSPRLINRDKLLP